MPSVHYTVPGTYPSSQAVGGDRSIVGTTGENHASVEKLPPETGDAALVVLRGLAC
jgi:hypothetical protein